MTATKTTHTPGPWKAFKPIGLAHWNIIGDQSICVANVFGHVGSAVLMGRDGQGDANARLIAAAPELLEALKAVQSALEMVRTSGSAQAIEGGYQTPLMLARTAITKAEGRT